MERKKPYKPGTIVTLKDGNVYRTSRRIMDACFYCAVFYGDGRNCPCAKEAFIKFAFPPVSANKTICFDMYGEFMYPKLITNEKSI